MYPRLHMLKWFMPQIINFIWLSRRTSACRLKIAIALKKSMKWVKFYMLLWTTKINKITISFFRFCKCDYVKGLCFYLLSCCVFLFVFQKCLSIDQFRWKECIQTWRPNNMSLFSILTRCLHILVFFSPQHLQFSKRHKLNNSHSIIYFFSNLTVSLLFESLQMYPFLF